MRGVKRAAIDGTFYVVSGRTSGITFLKRVSRCPDRSVLWQKYRDNWEACKSQGTTFRLEHVPSHGKSKKWKQWHRRLQNLCAQGCRVLNDEADTATKAALTFASEPPFRKLHREPDRATKRDGDAVNHIEKVAAWYDAVVATTTASVDGDWTFALLPLRDRLVDDLSAYMTLSPLMSRFAYVFVWAGCCMCHTIFH